MAYKISEDCIACGACAANCPVECIQAGDSKYEINPEICIECGTCSSVCPVGAPKLDD
ncbi:MAG: 4Fe-4S binding protein [Clostridia bacterium]|nr:4Fe-4S binding protein [Clostridia bacterium]